LGNVAGGLADEKKGFQNESRRKTVVWLNFPFAFFTSKYLFAQEKENKCVFFYFLAHTHTRIY
jgi:hypothetical protein